MIVRKRPNALMLFFVIRGSLIRRIWPQVAGVGVVSALVVVGHAWFPRLIPSVNSAPFALVGIALSIFLSFRNGASYDRWWEARRFWGELLQAARDTARQTVMIEDRPERRQILMAMVDFVHGCEAHLRGRLNPGDPTPEAALTEATRLVATLQREGRLLPIEALVLNESIVRASHALVGCERLLNTPLPFTYSLLLHRTAYTFCFILPFGFADTLGWVTPLMTALVGYTFFGLDALGEELEEPFGPAPNALPISAYATMIEITLRSALGDTDLPPMPRPVGYLLT